MNLGEAVYRTIARHSSGRERDTRSMIDRALAEAGGVSQLARALGVQRTTVQRWRKGSTPGPESTELLRSALRHAELREARAARIATSNALVVTGRQGTRHRTVNLGAYLAPGTMGRAVEAYQRGASPQDLHLIVWGGITDKHYRWMFQPPGGIAQQSPAARVEAVRQAMPPAEGGGGGGGGGGGSGGGGGAGGGGDDDEYSDDGYYDDSDLMYDDYDIGDNDGYEFT